jgi:hypothetical protein
VGASLSLPFPMSVVASPTRHSSFARTKTCNSQLFSQRANIFLVATPTTGERTRRVVSPHGHSSFHSINRLHLHSRSPLQVRKAALVTRRMTATAGLRASLLGLCLGTDFKDRHGTRRTNTRTGHATGTGERRIRPPRQDFG